MSGTAPDGTLSVVSKQFRVSKYTVSKLWKTLKETESVSSRKPPGRIPLLTQQHMLQLVRDFSSIMPCPTFTLQQLAAH